MTVTIHEAKTQLSKLIAAVEAGEEVIIARRDKPVVRLVKEEAYRPKLSDGFGVGRGLISEDAVEYLTSRPEVDEQIGRDFAASADEEKE
ncbi:MAG: type II toxin-antitoxin system prevent-host-death family antitoxin [Verrucomicrobiota bacterium JB023]|nr:type II toxin-antitoxin system prevent-host-death family antitoxin [Verrucomicrobiota bacterium JB023]